MDLPPDVLRRTPEEAARRIALGFLDEIRSAAARLADPADAEALHDFRVGIRRLRSTLRAWSGALVGSVRGRDRRALAALQEATGAGRDAEVALSWLRGEDARPAPAHRPAHAWLVERFERRLAAAMEAVASEGRAAFERLDATMGPALREMRVTVRLDAAAPAERFGRALGAAVRDAVDALLAQLQRVVSAEDREEAHRARILGKRLRYLVEPVRDLVPEAADLVARMKGLQDLLGDLHDAHVQQEEFGRVLEESAVEQARRLHDLAVRGDAAAVRRETRRSPRAGLLDLTRRAQARGEDLFARLDAEWLAGGGEAIREAGRTLSARLGSLADAGVERERKYLLRGRPDLPPGTASVGIEQGWLPGEVLRERLRRVTGPEGTRHLRTVKLGLGVERTEVEEEASAELFAALWPLTQGCRVVKRRSSVPDGDLTWEVDEFLDRDLFLAEVELDRADRDPPLPAWLAPQVVREVTGEAEWTNLRLAR